MNRIVIVGGGIAGVETALTLARTVPRASVTLVAQWPSLRVLPQIVYVPFGASPHAVDVRLIRALAPEGIDLRIATCERVDLARHELTLSNGTLKYESLIVAPGTIPEPTRDHRLRSLSDALRLRDALDQLASSTKSDRSIMLHVPSSCTWPPPAFEFALLLAKWRDEHGLNDVRITVAVEEAEPLEIFNLDVSTIIRDRFEHAGIELMTHVPGHRIDQVPSSLAIDFGGLSAHRILGLPSVEPGGFYPVDHTGRAGTDLYVVGDAALTSYKAAFATGWQARRVAHALGADLSLLGPAVDGIPLNECEYQMDMGDQSLCVRLAAPFHGQLSHDLHVTGVTCSTAKPDKLVGTLTHEIIERSPALDNRLDAMPMAPVRSIFRPSEAYDHVMHNEAPRVQSRS